MEAAHTQRKGGQCMSFTLKGGASLQSMGEKLELHSTRMMYQGTPPPLRMHGLV